MVDAVGDEKVVDQSLHERTLHVAVVRDMV
jgi:hypothetical protein